MSGAPLFKLTGVWERVSARGTRYFVGRLGAAKIVILPNREAGDDPDAPTHIVYLAEPNSPPAASDATNAATTAPPGPMKRRVRNAYSYLKPVADTPAADAGRPFNDPLDL
jgi:hypothetical protein